MNDLSFTPTGHLLKQYGETLAELMRRGVVRTKNAPLGDLAENCALQVYGGELAPNSTASYDLTTRNGARIQVKARQLSEKNPKTRRFSQLGSLDVEHCLFLIVDGDRIVRASEWSGRDVESHGAWQEKKQAWSVRVGDVLDNPQIGNDRTDEFQSAWSHVLSSTALDLEDRPVDLLDLQIRWVQRYNAYNRLAEEPSALERLLSPVWDEYRRSGTILQWSGIDLLKGWAFYLVREDYFAGGGTLGREFQDVLGAISRHPHRDLTDTPPGFPSCGAL